MFYHHISDHQTKKLSGKYHEILFVKLGNFLGQIGKFFGSNWESFWVKLGKFLGQIGKVFGSNWESFWVNLKRSNFEAI
jgi:hypothetical protein